MIYGENMFDSQLFISNVSIVAKQVGILYILVIVGIITDKIKLFTEKTAKACTDLLFYIVTPSVIINSFFKQEFSPESVRNLLISIGCGFLLHIIAIFITFPFFSKGDKDRNAIYKFGSVYGNVGYMVLPLTSAILGSEGVFYCSGVVMAFNVMAFTHGIVLMDNNNKKLNLKKLVLNPGVIGVAIGLPFYLLKISLPEIVTTPVSYVESMQTPLAMIIFGTYLANTDLISVFKNKKIFLSAFIKLILVPLVMYFVYKLFGLAGTLLYAMMISSSAPSANNTVLFSAKFSKDTGLASQLVSVVSILSIITMPLIIALVKTISR